VVVVLQPGTAASDELLAAARAEGGTVAVIIQLKIHGYAFGFPNPGLMPNARERAAAEDAITATVARLRRKGVDVDGQIVVTRQAHKAIVRIVRRRGATQVLLEPTTASPLRRFLEGDLQRQLTRQLRGSATVTTAAKAGGPPARQP
jgi:hypothetical protein